MTDKHTALYLEELFPDARRYRDQRQWLRFAGMDQQVAGGIAAHLGLGFLPHTASGQNHVCQANAEEVLAEYRTALTAQEVFWYIVGVLTNSPEGLPVIPLPDKPEVFWELVTQGRDCPFIPVQE